MCTHLPDTNPASKSSFGPLMNYCPVIFIYSQTDGQTESGAYELKIQCTQMG